MIKKNFLYLLVVVVLLFTCTGSSAENPIQLYINGWVVKPDPPPMIIDGRTMVPLRVIAENLDCDVRWNGNTSSVYIDKKKFNPTNEQPKIIGPDEFVKAIQDVLSLAKKDTKVYMYVTSAIKEITYMSNVVPDSDIVAHAITDERICIIHNHIFTELKKQLSKDEFTLYYLSILVHEATHMHVDNTALATYGLEEFMCYSAALKAVYKINPSTQTYAYTQCMALIDRELKL